MNWQASLLILNKIPDIFIRIQTVFEQITWFGINELNLSFKYLFVGLKQNGDNKDDKE
jgi:hypothetical protein